MKSLSRWIVGFLRSDSGPTAVEYAMLLALIIMVCLSAVTFFGQMTGQSFTNSANSIQNATAGSGS